METDYVDGVGIHRCLTCQSALRQKDDQPIVYLSRPEVELILRIFEEDAQAGENIIRRLHEVLGR